MPPQTRSRGVPPPSRVYHSTPGEQQVQFPPRRKVVRTYGKQTRRKENVAPARSLRQQTLTQIDFVSSFEEDRDPVVFSESDEDEENEDDVEEDEDKENRNVQNYGHAEEEDGEPVSSGRKRRSNSSRATNQNARTKRRRTVGDDSDTEHDVNSEKENRRKTLGDLPTSSYHTQTLTQFLNRDPSHALYIQDSEDEGENGFEDWLQDQASPSPLRRKNVDSSPATARRLRFVSPKRTQAVSESPTTNRQESIVPQTPVKVHTPAKRTTRDEIPSSSQLSSPADIPTPVNRMIERYGPPDKFGTPLKNKSSPIPKSILKQLPGKTRPRSSLTPRKKEVVIQDSFATGSWDKEEPTPQRSQNLESPSINRIESAETETSSALDEMETPTKPRRRGESAELGGKNRADSSTPKRPRFSPQKRKRVVLDEIPDSDSDEGDFDVFDENQDENEFIAGPETQFVMSELASTEEEESEESPKAKTTPPAALEIENDEHIVLASSVETVKIKRRPTISSPPLGIAPSSQPTTPSPPKTTANRPRVRKPLHEPALHAAIQTQPLESQRVPLATLQSLPRPSARTDIVLPLNQGKLSDVLEGYRADITLPFKIPAQVVRFWLFDGTLLQYMACADPGRINGAGTWRFALPQVYELNNPVDESSMREEEWINGEIGRYAYLPPAVVGQLMWNLRHTVFSESDAHPQVQNEMEEEEEEEEEEQVQLLPSSSRPQNKNPTPTPSVSVSQQVEAQLQSDIEQSTQFPTSDDILVPSTPDDENKQQRTNPASTSSTPTRAPPKNSTTNAFKLPPSRPPPLTPFTASSYRASRPPLNPVRPSQATTASQTSTPEKTSSSHRAPSYPQLHSSSSLIFNDDSPLHLPLDLATAAGNGGAVGESQLLTKSQTLPDSLVRDDERVPPEIWDSDDDVDARL